jgi:LEA14-like dessication related protein
MSKIAPSLLILLLVVAGCATPRPAITSPYVHLVNLVPLSSTVFEHLIRVEMRMQNTNGFALAFRGFHFELELNDTPFARGVSGDPVTLAPFGEEIVSVVASTTVFDLVRQLQALGVSDSLDYRITGEFFLTEPEQLSVDFERSGRLLGAGSY